MHRATTTATLGDKRNELVLGARGDFVALFDDDAIYGRDYVATLVAACAHARAQCCVLEGAFWRWRLDTRTYEFVDSAAGTGERQLFRRDAFRLDVPERRFSSVAIGEETSEWLTHGVKAPEGSACFLQVFHDGHTSHVGKPDRNPTSAGVAKPEADVPANLRALLAPLLRSPFLRRADVRRWRALFRRDGDGRDDRGGGGRGDRDAILGSADARRARQAALGAVAEGRGRLAVVGPRGVLLRGAVHLDAPRVGAAPRGAACEPREVGLAKEGAATWRVRVAAAGLEGWCTLKPELLAPDFDDDAAVDILLGLEPPPGLEL